MHWTPYCILSMVMYRIILIRIRSLMWNQGWFSCLTLMCKTSLHLHLRQNSFKNWEVFADSLAMLAKEIVGDGKAWLGKKQMISHPTIVFLNAFYMIVTLTKSFTFLQTILLFQSIVLVYYCVDHKFWIFAEHIVAIVGNNTPMEGWGCNKFSVNGSPS